MTKAKSNRSISITLLHIIGMAMILLCHIFQAEKKWIFGEIFIRFIEAISFYVYITHVIFVDDTYYILGGIGNKPLRYTVAVILSFASATLLWFITEKIILKLFAFKKEEKALKTSLYFPYC